MTMRTRLRLGAAAAIGLGALLLATVLASPALAWHSNVSVTAECLESGKVGVHYTVEAWEEGHDATVHVFYKLDSGEGGELDSGSFGEGQDEFSGDFELPAGTTGTVTVIAVADWKGGEESKNKGSAKLPDKCEKSTTTTSSSTTTSTTSSSTTTSTTLAPTTTSTQPTVGPTSTLAPTTTAAVGGVTTTTSGGQLPFTGAGSSQPMLLVGIALLGGGALVLLLTRSGRNTAS
jgi:hypothetical protein